MDKVWLSNDNNSSCILFFNGWGMGVEAVKHIDTDGFDVCMLHNYDDDFTLDESDLNYDNIYVVAWSLGVCVADSYLRDTQLNICKSIAINGTPYGMHPKWGIAEETFTLTMKTWSERNRKKFNMRMCGGKAEYDNLRSFLVSRDVHSQAIELSCLYCFISNSILDSLSGLCQWNKAYVSSEDLVITSVNQLTYWKDKTVIKGIESGHFPFHKLKSWSNIIE